MMGRNGSEAITTGPGRARRTGAQVRSSIEGAARAAFAERGFAGATTRDIAQRAGLTEVLIFRHYGSKARLFDQVVLAPFGSLFADFVAANGRAMPDRLHKNEDFVGSFYPFLLDNADLLQAMMRSSPALWDGEAGEARAPDGLARYFEAAAARLDAQYEAEGVRPDVEPMLAVRYCFGMLAAAVLFEDWFFPGAAPDRVQATASLSRMLFKALSPLDPSGAAVRG